MADYRKILVLVLEGRSYREVVEIVGCSHRDVARVRQEVHERGLSSAALVSDFELAEWFPDGRRKVSEEYDQPDLARVLAAMKANRHFTLLLAWRRYVDTNDVGKKYGYSQFCALFTDYLRSHDLVAVLRHEPGRAMLVDWAGDTIDLVDTITGGVVKAILFVAVLPFSGLIFCQAFTDMKSPAWLDAHVKAFDFFGGVPQIVVPDNPTTATNRSHPGDAERVVNARYQQLADHYQTAIVPARVKRPRDKAAAENAVNVVNKRVIGYLETDVFTTLSELNNAIAERVREINHDIRRADDSTRWERFEAEEKEFLGPLPDAGFEDVEWKELKAARNYHITADTQRYSVPYLLAGKLLRVRLTASKVTVFDGHDSICEHPRLTGRKGQYSTLPEHVPPQHRNVEGLWSRHWFTDRARSVGPATVAVIEQILDSQTIEAQGYLACQNILDGLGKNNRERLEVACQDLLNRRAHPTYSTLKRLMAAIDSDAKKPRPVTPAASTRKRTSTIVFRDTGPDVYVRDASHYERDEEGI
jgi:transposase